MFTVTVTGASGFVGRHVVRWLSRSRNCRVIASGRNEEQLQRLGVEYVVQDLGIERNDYYDLLGRPDRLIHLAWGGLPNYNDLLHLEHNLLMSYRFLKNMVAGGLRSLTVAGTCYEYGLQAGCLAEDAVPRPTTCYAMAKNALRLFLEELKKQYPFRLTWGRFFFLHGEGQHPRALIPQVDRAMARNEKCFDMSGGEQLRDYLPVEEASRLLVLLAMQDRYEGICNICSGEPISVRRLVEDRIARRGSGLRLNLGVFPYPEHEPMAYWGDAARLRKIVEESNVAQLAVVDDDLRASAAQAARGARRVR
ncbi:MAG: NAD(P)-dependent oxidoreductase [Syntrophorhabdales bacterium]|jgi:dTDP-6-deoxy-L-talose 4-dehydrogenase (NAD+)